MKNVGHKKYFREIDYMPRAKRYANYWIQKTRQQRPNISKDMYGYNIILYLRTILDKIYDFDHICNLMKMRIIFYYQKQ